MLGVVADDDTFQDLERGAIAFAVRPRVDHEGAELVLMGATDELPEVLAVRSPPASRAPRRAPAGA